MEGEWIYGSLLAESENTFPIIARDYDNDEDWIGINEWSTVIPETVGQYTGLTDKNGKKIFEGDIVKTNKFNEPNKKYIIKYALQFGAFIGEDKYHMYFTTFDGDSDQFEVIGNIHDNPELLEVK
jgi:uncharacterized phage protein (TIGR01671 family)